MGFRLFHLFHSCFTFRVPGALLSQAAPGVGWASCPVRRRALDQLPQCFRNARQFRRFRAEGLSLLLTGKTLPQRRRTYRINPKDGLCAPQIAELAGLAPLAELDRTHWTPRFHGRRTPGRTNPQGSDPCLFSVPQPAVPVFLFSCSLPGSPSSDSCSLGWLGPCLFVPPSVTRTKQLSYKHLYSRIWRRAPKWGGGTPSHRQVAS